MRMTTRGDSSATPLRSALPMARLCRGRSFRLQDQMPNFPQSQKREFPRSRSSRLRSGIRGRIARHQRTRSSSRAARYSIVENSFRPLGHELLGWAVALRDNKGSRDDHGVRDLVRAKTMVPAEKNSDRVRCNLTKGREYGKDHLLSASKRDRTD